MATIGWQKRKPKHHGGWPTAIRVQWDRWPPSDHLQALHPVYQHATPYSIQTVNSIVSCDNWNGTACAGISATTSYEYSGGYHHFAEREFRGFNSVKVTAPSGPNGEQAITETWFHQGNDLGVDSNNPNVPTGYTKGMPYRSKVTDATGKVYSETTTAYVADNDLAAPGTPRNRRSIPTSVKVGHVRATHAPRSHTITSSEICPMKPITVIWRAHMMIVPYTAPTRTM